ncbi:hypothetical protein CEXT_305541 [Caerostris extrusa]|uniref:Uncharacterized protein n=1 Tax=Caerostris extrusa TaxID=172846 RepID=A0AAV4WW06_CAEEX|nr:hypothetical protein CEXT_305541 [Caerostris extrusa]
MEPSSEMLQRPGYEKSSILVGLMRGENKSINKEDLCFLYSILSQKRNYVTSTPTVSGAHYLAIIHFSDITNQMCIDAVLTGGVKQELYGIKSWMKNLENGEGNIPHKNKSYCVNVYEPTHQLYQHTERLCGFLIQKAKALKSVCRLHIEFC